jgi:hypothetical protein
LLYCILWHFPHPNWVQQAKRLLSSWSRGWGVGVGTWLRMQHRSFW